MSEHWVQKWGDDGWAFDDPNGQEATLGVYQRKGEWRSVVQARAGLDTEDIAARVIAKLANRVAELEAAVASLADDAERYMEYHAEKFYGGTLPTPTGLTPSIAKARSLVERKEEW